MSEKKAKAERKSPTPPKVARLVDPTAPHVLIQIQITAEAHGWTAVRVFPSAMKGIPGTQERLHSLEFVTLLNQVAGEELKHFMEQAGKQAGEQKAEEEAVKSALVGASGEPARRPD